MSHIVPNIVVLGFTQMLFIMVSKQYLYNFLLNQNFNRYKNTSSNFILSFWIFFVNDRMRMDNQSILGIVDLNKEVYSILLLKNSLSETTFNKICLDLYIDHSIILILLFDYENAMLPFGKFIS